MSSFVINKVKEFQLNLGLPLTGVWDELCQNTLDASMLKVALKPEFVETLLNIRSSIPREDRRESIYQILEACNTMIFDGKRKAKNPLYIGYIFATAYHETAYTLYPISEYGRGTTRKYGKVYRNSKGARYGIKNNKGHAYDYEKYPFTYFGRGLVQLTWFDNYEDMSKVCGIDLTCDPEQANNPQYASKILVHGMIKGNFTGRRLNSYIKYGLKQQEFIDCRRIINGTDKARQVSNHTYKFIDNMILV